MPHHRLHDLVNQVKHRSDNDFEYFQRLFFMLPCVYSANENDTQMALPHCYSL